MAEAWQILFVAFVVAGVFLAVFVFGLGTTTDPVPWRQAFGSSSCSCIPQQGLWFYRFAVAALYVVFFIDTLTTRIERYGADPGILFYLTIWNNISGLVYFITLVVYTRPGGATDLGQKLLLPTSASGATPEDPQPNNFKGLLVNFTVQLPLGWVVAILYWVLLVPVQELCIFGAPEPCRATPDIQSQWLHLFSQILCLTDFLIGSIPFYLANAGWFIIVGIAYTVWTAVNHFLGIGTISFPCDGGLTPPSECPLYKVVDWRQPETALITVAAIGIVGAPLIALAVRAVGACRTLATGGKLA